jgi:regulation of enolase protein 1 (concanavalin A-like superfamily)
MTLREFMRFHLLKTLLIFVVIQIAIVAYLQNFNHRPEALPDSASVFAGQSVKISPLPNDIDKDEKDEPVLKNFTKPLHGKVIKDENLLSYTPDKGFVGTDSFTYTITDGRKESKNSWIVVQVNKNQGPIAGRDFAEIYSGSRAVIDVLGNDNDRENDSVFIKGYSQPRYGNVSLVDKKLVYSPTISQAKTDSFRYVSSDGLSNSDSATVVVNVKSKSDPNYPWLSSDIGDAAIPGSFTRVNNTFKIVASGSDIWNSYDGFRYAYQYVSGDCEMYTKVESLEGNNEWAKAGLMIRETLAGSSKCAFVIISNKNGATYHQRFSANSGMEGGEKKTEIKAPYWVKIVRKGNSISYYVSSNGAKWDVLFTLDVPMTKDVYIGFAVTSHNNSEQAKAVFSNYKMTGKTVNL